MKKLALKLDDLSVESFETVMDPSSKMGTVRGHHSHNPADSACWGTGCNQSAGNDHCGGYITEGQSCGYQSECCTYTQGNDDTCINCTAQAANCTQDVYFCNVVTEGTCWTQHLCC